MIVCNKCGKENQDHYKFCLGCGSELVAPAPPPPVAPQLAARKTTNQGAPRAVAPVVSQLAVSPTPPAGMPQVGRSELPEPLPDPGPTEPPLLDDLPSAMPDPVLRPSTPQPADAPPAGMVACPKCGQHNPKEFLFCGNCGQRVQPSGAGRTVHLAARGGPAPVEARPKGKLGLIRPDGSEGGSHQLMEADCRIGRGTGQLFDHDSYLSPNHARFVFDGGRLILEDAGSLNGVFARITQEESLQSGDIFRIGQELLRFDAILEPQILEDGTEIMGSPNPGYWGRLSVIMGPGVDGSAFPLMGEEMVLGRERGDILFSDDGYVSGIHAKLSVREDGYFLTDLGSSNGTFIRLTQPRVAPTGTFILMGQQLFRIEY
jgi:pSer/pThr/pTyr-binding forkhead associated (FHA) protein